MVQRIPQPFAPFTVPTLWSRYFGWFKSQLRIFECNYFCVIASAQTNKHTFHG